MEVALSQKYDLNQLDETIGEAPAILSGIRSEKAAGIKMKIAKTGKPELSRLAELILKVDSRISTSKPEQLAAARAHLAAGLGCRAEDLQEIVDSYGEDWDQMVLEERVKIGIDQTTFRDSSWDRLEGAVLRKLETLVEIDAVNSVNELLAIARVANMANRGDRAHKSAAGQGSAVIQNNVYLPGNPEGGVLPAGHLGKIQLNLTSRVMKQIEGTAEKSGNGNGEGREIDSVEMMTVEQIQAAGNRFEEAEQEAIDANAG